MNESVYDRGQAWPIFTQKTVMASASADAGEVEGGANASLQLQLATSIHSLQQQLDELNALQAAEPVRCCSLCV